MKSQRRRLSVRYLASNVSIVLGLVLCWRGIWYILDWVDATFFGDNHLYLGVGGVILGLAVLYLPDHDLKEIQQL